MNVYLQILCIIISFIYGIVISIGYRFNKKLNTSNFIWQLIFSILYSFIVVLLYIIIIYKINGGIFHIYFIFALIIGYFMSNFIVKYIKIKRATKQFVL